MSYLTFRKSHPRFKLSTATSSLHAMAVATENSVLGLSLVWHCFC